MGRGGSRKSQKNVARYRRWHTPHAGQQKNIIRGPFYSIHSMGASGNMRRAIGGHPSGGASSGASRGAQNRAAPRTASMASMAAKPIIAARPFSCRGKGGGRRQMLTRGA